MRQVVRRFGQKQKTFLCKAELSGVEGGDDVLSVLRLCDF